MGRLIRSPRQTPRVTARSAYFNTVANPGRIPINVVEAKLSKSKQFGSDQRPTGAAPHVRSRMPAYERRS